MDGANSDANNTCAGGNTSYTSLLLRMNSPWYDRLIPLAVQLDDAPIATPVFHYK